VPLRRLVVVICWRLPFAGGRNQGVGKEDRLHRGRSVLNLRDVCSAIERLATAPAAEGLVMPDIWLLRLRALLARAHGDDARYREYRDRYRDMARTLGFEGHIAWAEAMP
jgi:hypothetical protein